MINSAGTGASPPNGIPSDWDDCRPGELTKFTQRIHRRQMLLLAGKTIASAGGVALLGAGGWWAYLRQLETNYQYYGMTCSDVRELLPAYRAGRLDSARSEILAKHVRRCSQCAEFRGELRS
ncbi:MAG TPA: zf-HC2 domain-containing protein [Schlesneria sp.]|jgi:hypothetical protein